MIELQPFNIQHFDQLINWIDSPKTLYQFAGPIFNYPLTAEQLNVYIKDHNRYPYSVWSTELQTTIGHAELIVLNATTAKICRLLIGPNYRGQGYGLALTNALINLAYEQFKKTNIILNVYNWNKTAIDCYLKCGFQFNYSDTKQFHFEDEIWVSYNMFYNFKGL